jgi:hypothetical protein
MTSQNDRLKGIYLKAFYLKNLELSKEDIKKITSVVINERKRGGKARINTCIPFIAILTSNKTEFFFALDEAQYILDKMPLRVEPEDYVIYKALELENKAKENGRFNCSHTDNKTLPLNQADTDKKKSLNGFSLTSPKKEGGNQ